MLKSLSLGSFCVALAITLAVQASAQAASAATQRTIIRLFGPTVMKGKATYEERPRFGSTLRRFKVQVERGLPLQQFPVEVNGTLVGLITTNAGGFGKFELRTPQFISGPQDGQPMPPGFPRMTTGDTVTVGPLSGSGFNTLTPTFSQRYRIGGNVETGGFEVSVKYIERFKKTTLRRIFDVEIEGGTPGDFPVLVNGNEVGTVTVDSSGNGEFELESPQFIEAGDTELPMPDSFPTLVTGDVVTVGSTIIIMGVSTSSGGDDDDGGGGGGNSGPGGGGDD